MPNRGSRCTLNAFSSASIAACAAAWPCCAQRRAAPGARRPRSSCRAGDEDHVVAELRVHRARSACRPARASAAVWNARRRTRRPTRQPSEPPCAPLCVSVESCCASVANDAPALSWSRIVLRLGLRRDEDVRDVLARRARELRLVRVEVLLTGRVRRVGVRREQRLGAGLPIGERGAELRVERRDRSSAVGKMLHDVLGGLGVQRRPCTVR